ncbi:MAG TPA: DUF2652 domain-containing protein [Candidatus Limnocylindrales bacterium]|nr:DUF2652 domain-containing protein [Candidatus Limnocylindrales bacterium]
MQTRLEPACLVIADISGYTGYLAGVELDHAQDILADLIGTVVGALRPSFRLAKLEGDAAFAYVLAETVDGAHLQDTLERCYFAFRRRLRDIRQSSTCECNACMLIPNLNLKILAHHGVVARHRIAGREELVGSDVVVVHRLLKNRVEEDLGLAAYAMYTDACIRAMGADPAVLGLREHREDFEGVGEVVGWVRDLEAAWRDEEARTETIVRPEESAAELAFVLPGPAEVVWEWITSPARRIQWQAAGGVTDVRETTVSGRRGVGTTNHCMHGRDAIVEEILDWRPFEHFTVRFQMPVPGVPKMVMSELLEPVTGGTRVTLRIRRPRTAKDRAAIEPLRPMFEASMRAGIEPLGELVAADVAARSAAAADAEEPPVPASAGRNMREPLAAEAR